MKMLFACAAAAVYLCLLCGPSFFVARTALRAGNRAPFRALRFIFPFQLVATFALLFMADASGWGSPAGLFVAFTMASSAAGAAACKLLGWYSSRRRAT